MFFVTLLRKISKGRSEISFPGGGENQSSSGNEDGESWKRADVLC